MIRQYNHRHLKSAIEAVLQSLMISIVAVAFLSGCSLVGPDYVKPVAPEPKEWIQKDEAKVKTEGQKGQTA